MKFLSPSVIAAGLFAVLAPAQAAAPQREAALTRALRAQVRTVVVIYAENRSFDNMYGLFPGARGLNEVLAPDGTPLTSYVPQTDRAAGSAALAELPRSWGGVLAKGQLPEITPEQSAHLANRPFRIDQAYPVTTAAITADPWHLFFLNQMQIDTTGRRDNSKFAAYSNVGGLVMGYYDGSSMRLWDVAKHYVLADNFFMGAFGGSFLNHQYLACACAPSYPDADQVKAKPSIASLRTDAAGHYLPLLQMKDPASSATTTKPEFVTLAPALAPKDYFGPDDGFRAVNSMQPPYQPSISPPPPGDATRLTADLDLPGTLPPQTRITLGHLLTSKGVDWAWYAGGWNETLAASTAPVRPTSLPNPPYFQFHHQPYNYYENFDPTTAGGVAQRKAHLKDYDDLMRDIDAGKLPPVTFYKPQGNLNQHPGYTEIVSGDAHIADLLERLQRSPQWAHMVVVVTYDENGGFWDHVPPPQGDLLGPGTRIPALIVSPLAQRGLVDHTQYDTGSILRLITRVFDLPVLPGLAARDAALVAHGHAPMGDLTSALKLN